MLNLNPNLLLQMEESFKWATRVLWPSLVRQKKISDVYHPGKGSKYTMATSLSKEAYAYQRKIKDLDEHMETLEPMRVALGVPKEGLQLYQNYNEIHVKQDIRNNDTFFIPYSK